MCWQWGDLLVRGVPRKQPRDAIERLHREVPDAPAVATLANYRSVAQAWPKSQRRRASWEAHSILRSHRDLLKDGMTGADARRARGERRAVAPRVLTYGIERAQAARRWIKAASAVPEPARRAEMAAVVEGLEADIAELREAYDLRYEAAADER